MALTPPTVAGSPPTKAETNAGFTSINGFLTTAYSEVLTAGREFREFMRLRGCTTFELDQMDLALGGLSSSVPAPAVVADPADKTETNAALTTMTALIDSYNTKAKLVFTTVRNFLNRLGFYRDAEAMDTAMNALSSPSTLTPEQVAADPVDTTETNTAFANTVAFIDTANAETVTSFNLLVTAMYVGSGSQGHTQRFINAIGIQAAH